MVPEMRELAAFYDSPTGQMARRVLLARVRAMWPQLAGQRLLGLGHATPYLRPFMAEAERVVAASPAAEGARPWPAGGPSLVAVAEERHLPFPDAMFDRILLVHGLETAEAQRPMLREIWRLLTPEGRLMIVAPNRTSLWAQLETSPFGQGQPYSRTQLERLLRDALFVPEHWDAALHMPPFKRRKPSSGMGWERMGRRMWPKLAGVHIVEASKSMYAPVFVGKAEARPTPATA
jgi:SAM-dependent methyltransferase